MSANASKKARGAARHNRRHRQRREAAGQPVRFYKVKPRRGFMQAIAVRVGDEIRLIVGTRPALQSRPQVNLPR